MSTFLLNMLISLAFKLGIEWVLHQFPGIPQAIKDILLKLEQDAAQNPAQAPQLKAQALADAKSCIGVTCKTDEDA